MGYPALQFWFNIIQALMTLLLFFYTRRVTRQKAAEARFQKIESALEKKTDESVCREHQARTASIETRVSEMKVEVNNLPTFRQFAELNKNIQALSDELHNTQGRLEGVNRAVDIINQFLISEGSHK